MKVPLSAVVDATIGVKWVVSEAGSERAASLQRASLLAPDVFVTECANVLWKKVSRGELTSAEACLAAATLERSPVTLIATRPLLEAATRLAIDLKYPAYDCFYLLVASERGIPLVTADERLLRLVRGVPAALLATLPAVISLAELDG